MWKDAREPLTAGQEAELRALVELPDSTIDLSDMPEVTDWSGAARGKHYRPEDPLQYRPDVTANGPQRVPLPAPVARIYEAVEELQRLYRAQNRTFTPDGHLVGSIGEVIAAEALGLTLYPTGRPGHDARDQQGRDVQIKMTATSSVAMYDTSERLVVLRVISPAEAEIVYDGPGQPAWDSAGKMGKTSQRVISLSKLRAIAAKSVA